MTAITTSNGAGPSGSHLTTLKARTLSRGILAGLAAVTILISLGLFAVTPLQGQVDFVLFAGAVYLVAQTVLSAVVEGGRRARDRIATSAVMVCFLLALVPLVAVTVSVIEKGVARFDSQFLTHSMRNISATDVGGGAYHAIIGTIEQVAIAALIAVPFSLMVAIYLVEYGRGRLSRTISFFVDVLTGLPSIIAGLFILAFWIVALGQNFSGFAGSLALVVIMIPIVTRSAEEMLKLVPNELREASYALGVARWRTILRVVIPTALPGIVTGVMLAIARVAGETAPVLLVTFGSQSINTSPFHGPQESLPLYIYQQATQGIPSATDRAWSAALFLILIITVLNVIARFTARRSRVS
ncbi:MAG: phosphate ABC transporter permease PstA [Frankia sp.]